MNRLTTLFCIFTLMIGFNFSQAQNTFPSSGAAGIGTSSPNASSLLDVVSTTKGVLVPRMNKAQRDAIGSPAEGLLIYQTNSTPGFYYYDGTNWKAVSPKGVNKSLNNLTAPTAVNVDLLPESDASIDLGSSSKSWKDVYLDGSIYFDGNRFAGNTATNTYFGSNTLISNTTGHDNTAVGSTALNLNTTGYYNTAVGSRALNSNTTAFYNTAVGFEALFSTATGGNNTAIGMEALHDNTGSYNTAVGTNSLNKNITGFHNTATGFYALLYNTSGDYNTAMGSEALIYNTTGYSNTAAGYESLQDNTAGYLNTAYGNYSLQSNTTGFANSACGVEALTSNTTGNYNVANGYKSLASNTTGGSNTAQGYRALFSNTTGYSNVAIGSRALYYSSTQSNLVAIGDSALYNSDGTANTAIGSKTLFSNTTGSYNAASGRLALYSNTTSSYNTADGYRALYANTTGDKNTAVGYGAGSLNDMNSSCSFFGYDADQTATTDFSNSMALGNTARITASSQVRIGNSTVSSIGGYTGWSNISDGRYKKDIQENVPGIEFINKLKPVTYHLDVNGISKFLGEDVTGEEGPQVEQGGNEKEKIIYTGFIAQDVEQAAKEIGYDFSGVDKPQNENSLYGLRYAEFVVPLVKSVQELDSVNRVKNETIKSLQSENSTQQKQIDDLRSQVAQLLSFNSPGNDGFAKLQIQDANTETVLGQNIPNPFDNSTIIPFRIPKACNGASLVIAESATGRIVTAIPITCSETHISVEAGNLAAGHYSYSLYVDGKMIDTKTMMLTK